MKILVCGATGCIGSAVAKALRSRGHTVVNGARGVPDGPASLAIDFMTPVPPADWAARLADRHIDAVVNCVGILMEQAASAAGAGQRFARVHAAGPIELFKGAALAGVGRVVQVSALGVGPEADRIVMPYLHSKLLAEEALAALPLAGVVLRPSLVYGPGSQSAALFATLAGLPVIALPGRGNQRVQPIHVYELAEIVARLLEDEVPRRGVFEIGGADPSTWREMLATYRRALRLAEPLWLPCPMPLMHASALCAEALPQQVFCRDTLRLLQLGNVPAANAAAMLLGREPSTLAQGLKITPPSPWFELRAELSPALDLGLRASLAFVWISTALISLAFQQRSGVMELLARCGLDGAAATATWLFSCGLNLSLGLLTLWRPSPLLYATQLLAIVGYTVTAAVNMPELTLDHCEPLTKNLPLAVAVLVGWLALAGRPGRLALEPPGGTMAGSLRHRTDHALHAPDR